MLKLHRITRTRTRLAAILLVAGGALASMLVYASRPAAVLSADADASEPMYRIAMVLSRDGNVIARPRLIVAAGKQSSIEFNHEGGSSTRLELIVDPVSAAEFERVKNRSK